MLLKLMPICIASYVCNQHCDTCTLVYISSIRCQQLVYIATLCQHRLTAPLEIELPYYGTFCKNYWNVTIVYIASAYSN